jgi:hypothetical protein
MNILIAIDPGMSGGIAFRADNGPAGADKMPKTEKDICELLQSLSPILSPASVYMEDVPIGMPGKGAASSKLNANAGFIRGVICSMGLKTVMVRPAKWQRHFGLGKRSGCASDTEWKNKLKQAAQRLYPDIKVTLDTADALLLLEYGRVQQ